MTGFFDSQNHSIVPIKIHGAYPQAAKNFNAMIDTGFTGFISMPLGAAMSVALILASTGNFVLADGRTSATLLCFGTVSMEGQLITGLISVSQGNEVLIGVDLLKKLNKKLLLDFTANKLSFD